MLCNNDDYNHKNLSFTRYSYHAEHQAFLVCWNTRLVSLRLEIAAMSFDRDLASVRVNRVID